MPKFTGQAKFSLDGAINAHARDTTEYGQDFSDPPPGISNGIARLVRAYIGEYQSGDNKGQKFLRLQATIVEPESVTSGDKYWNPEAMNGKGGISLTPPTVRPCSGLFTTQMFPLCEARKKTADENVAAALNELRKIGGEECTAELQTEEDLENLLESLEEAGPYFRFSTSSRNPSAEYPDPGVWQNWHRAITDYVPSENGAVNDQTPMLAKRASAEPEPDSGEDEPGVQALGDGADNGDQDAVDKLTEMAREAGVPDEDVENAKSWAHVAKLIEAAQNTDSSVLEGETSEETTEEEEESEPEKGQVFKYRPMDPKTKKPVKRPVDCEVVAVDKRAGTVALKNLATPKVQYKGVKWDDLE